jgi:hypothetical protein
LGSKEAEWSGYVKEHECGQRQLPAVNPLGYLLDQLHVLFLSRVYHSEPTRLYHNCSVFASDWWGAVKPVPFNNVGGDIPLIYSDSFSDSTFQSVFRLSTRAAAVSLRHVRCPHVILRQAAPARVLRQHVLLADGHVWWCQARSTLGSSETGNATPAMLFS